MSQAAGLDKAQDMQTENVEHRSISLPVDGIIRAIASRVGGSKAKEVERFLKFAMVGTLGAIIDLGTSNLLMATVLPPIGENRDLHIAMAATFSFIAAVLSNFTWNRYWTYPDSRSTPLIQQLGQFAIVSVSGWLGRTTWVLLSTPFLIDIVSSTLQNLDITIFQSEQAVNQVGGTLAILIAIFIVMIWNFFVNRYWTYGDVD
jgi:putative flippase GtrA